MKVKRFGKVISNRSLARPLMIRSAASSTSRRKGIGKSFLSVSGVRTKPGVMTWIRMPMRSRSNFRLSLILMRAALLPQ